VAPERGALQLLTTDALVEGVHFDRRFSSLADVGYKAIAVNASDIAAMGGTPSLGLLSLMLPAAMPLPELDALLDGVIEMAAAARLSIAGGNITRSPDPLIVDVMMTGHVRPRRVLTRGGGRPGDALYVTGTIGAAAAGLQILEEGGDAAGRFDECVARHRRPRPRLRVGAVLGRTRAATACIDLSDGLADAVVQLASASGTGAIVEADAIPVHPSAAAWFSARAEDPVLRAVSGGDDYELLFSVSPKSMGRLRGVLQRARGVPIARIGSLTEDPRVLLARQGTAEPMPQGFVHF
jgi:thiamine-monophosphate kinase